MRVDDATQERRELVAGEQRGKQKKAVGGWRPAEELVAGQEKGQLRLETTEGS